MEGGRPSGRDLTGPVFGMPRIVRWAAALIFAGGTLALTLALAQDARTWSFSHDGFSVTLTPLTYDQAASFFLARGLPQSETERYARRCVLATTLRNERGAGAIGFRSGEWIAGTAGASMQPVRTRVQWLEEFARAAVPEAARIAFEWAQVPDQHEFEPGDWIQGMLAVPVGRGAIFDLKLRWTAGGEEYERWITEMRCP